MNSPVVWFDMPALDLQRAMDFYTNVASLKITEEFPGVAVIAHGPQSVSGCLYKTDEIEPSNQGVLLYFAVNGRLDAAVAEVENFGGQILEQPKAIGEFGHRAVVLDSEGNRIALHSE